MEQLRKLFYLLLILPLLFVNTGCSDDDEDNPVVPQVTINEADVLAKYLENDMGDFINSTNCPAMIPATTVNSAILASDATQFVVDIRSASDFALGHITGAVNVSLKEIVNYYEANNLASYTTVVIACYSGQTAAYATSLLQLLGYTNVKDLKYGMCSWNAATSASWTNSIGNARAAEFVTTPTAKNAAGELPVLSTGKTTGAEILRDRVQALLATTDPFGDAATSNGTVYGNLSNYYIVNYWDQTDYDWGHIAGAVQYSPRVDLKLDTALKTLPTDKTVVVYCYTGQTSAHVALYLKLLGYDAKSLKFGVNGMAHDTMPGTVFNEATDVHNFDLVM